MLEDESVENGPMRLAPKSFRTTIGGPRLQFSGSHWDEEDWKRISADREGNWQEAVDLFEDRICGRFLDAVEVLEKNDLVRFTAGFSIMALDCLLIETLQQFKEGKQRTDNTPGAVKEAFCKFLLNSKLAPHCKNGKAAAFYDAIRNGLLHQAEIKGDSRIVIGSGWSGDFPAVKWTKSKKGLIINRRLFHAVLMEEFQSYLEQLRNPADMTQELKDAFWVKMNFIASPAKHVKKGAWRPCPQQQQSSHTAP